ncbi:MAG: hypothetical protein ACXWM7_06960 [Parachlamydiaceae bacterium]
MRQDEYRYANGEIGFLIVSIHEEMLSSHILASTYRRSVPPIADERECGEIAQGFANDWKKQKKPQDQSEGRVMAIGHET